MNHQLAQLPALTNAMSKDLVQRTRESQFDLLSEHVKIHCSDMILSVEHKISAGAGEEL